MANRGRPRKITPAVLEKLEEGFTWGYTDKEACLHADIHPATLYHYCEKNPDFSERKEVLKKQPNMLAKKNIFAKLYYGDDHTSKWQLEKRDRDYNPKQQLDHSSSDGTMTPTKIEIVAGGNSEG